MTFYDFNSPSSFITEQDVFFGIGNIPFGAQVEDLDLGAKGKVVDGTGSGSDWTNKRVATRDAEWKAKGHYHGDIGVGISWALHWLFGRRDPIPVWATLSGLDIGNVVHAMPATITDSSGKSSMNDSGKFDGQFDGRGASDLCTVMASPYTTNVLTVTGVSAAVDHSLRLPAGSYGGALYSFVFDMQGGTAPTCAPRLTHCATSGGTYVDVPGGAAPTITSVDKSTWMSYTPIASTTLINPFTKLNWTTSTSADAPTGIQPLILFARRPQRGKLWTGIN